jgi:hypothetical protein
MSNPGMVKVFVTKQSHNITEARKMLNTWQFHYVDIKIINSVSWTSFHKRHNHELQAVCIIFIFSICALYKGVLPRNTCNIFGFLKVK